MKKIMVCISIIGILLVTFFLATPILYKKQADMSKAPKASVANVEAPREVFGIPMKDIREQTICLGVGKDETQMLVTWQGTGEKACVKMAEGDTVWTGTPETTAVFPAETAYRNDWGTCTFRAVLSDLIPGNSYQYQVVDSAASDVYTFQVPKKGAFSFLVNGDPQIESADDLHSMEIYDNLLTQAAGTAVPTFVMTLGDQVHTTDDPELFLRYLTTGLSAKFPIVPLVGNHEKRSDVFSRFFYMPNMDSSTINTSGDMSGDYWFVRNQVLFVCLNSNIHDMSVHEQFIKKVKANCTKTYGKPIWVVSAFHESIFSVGYHAEHDADTLVDQRKEYTSLMEELGADVVFMGHDHSYARTYPINQGEVIKDSASEAVDSKGIVYFTLNSSTGTKYYALTDGSFDYVAFCSQNYQPEAVRVDVTDTTFTVTDYYLQEDGTLGVLDSYELTKGK